MTINNIGHHLYQTTKEYIIKNSGPLVLYSIKDGQSLLVWKNYSAILEMLQLCMNIPSNFSGIEIDQELDTYVRNNSQNVKKVNAIGGDTLHHMYRVPAGHTSDGYCIFIKIHDKVHYHKEYETYIGWSTIWY